MKNPEEHITTECFPYVIHISSTTLESIALCHTCGMGADHIKHERTSLSLLVRKSLLAKMKGLTELNSEIDDRG